MSIELQLAVIEYLENFVTPERQARIDAVLTQRTRYLTVIVEDLHDAHNASAILRTCEALGIQDVHVVENFNTFKPRRGAASGSDKWLTLHRYNQSSVDNTQACLARLRSQGYRLVATTPHAKALPPEAVPLDQKLAILVGSERYGVSQIGLQTADLRLQIPMAGFIESLNVSVSAALCLYALTRRLRQLDISWQLSDREKRELRLEWLRHSARHSQHLEKHFRAQQNS